MTTSITNSGVSMHNIPQVSVADPTVDTSAPEWDAVQTGLRWNLISVIIAYTGLFMIMVAGYLSFSNAPTANVRNSKDAINMTILILNAAGTITSLIGLLLSIVSQGLCCLTPHAASRGLAITSVLLIGVGMILSGNLINSFAFQYSRQSQMGMGMGMSPELFFYQMLGIFFVNWIQHVFFCAYLLSLGYHLRSGDLVHRTKGYLLTLVITIAALIVTCALSAAIMNALKIADFLSLVILVALILGFGFIAYRYIWAILGTRQLFHTKPEQLAITLRSARPPAPPINPFE
jgi:hypothetical protein